MKVQGRSLVRETGALIAVVLIAGFGSVPYLDKSYHIDDVLYLRGVEQVLRSPMDPYAGLVLWDAKDGQPASLFATDHNPPLWKYILAGVLKAFTSPDRWANAERELHAATAVVVLVGAFGVYFASRLLTPYPLWCTAMIYGSPYYLPGQNLMLEPPLLCFTAWSVVFQQLAWRGNAPLAWSLVAGFAIAAAVLTKYTGGLLLPIFFAGCLLHQNFRATAFLIPPILALSAWAWLCIQTHGRSHLGSHGLAFDPAIWHLKTLSVLRTIGAVQLFGPVLAIAIWNTPGKQAMKLARISTLAVFSALIAFADIEQARFHARPEGWEPSNLQAVQYLAFTFHGAFTVASTLMLLYFARANRSLSTDHCWLFIWIAALFAFNVACTPFNAVRHLLLLLVPLVWLLAGLVKELASVRRRGTLLAASVILAAGLAAADYQFARSSQAVAERNVRPMSAERSARGRNVWYTGNWGFVYYAQQAGAHPWIVDPPKYGLPAPGLGDYVVHPVLLTWTDLSKPLPKGCKLRWIQHWQPMAENSGWPTESLGQLFRTVSPGVNYYSVRHYSLPWEFFLRPADEIERKEGVWWTVPTLGDYNVYEIVGIDAPPYGR